MKTLKLNSFHRSRGAKFAPFAGWSMPVSYGSAIEEHLATRKSVMLFDVSHMGEIEVVGRGAASFLSFVLSNNVNCPTGKAFYSLICDSHGGTVDDVIVYRRSEENFLLCVNASNVMKDFEHLVRYSNSYDCKVVDRSSEFGQLAVQGPGSPELMHSLFGKEISEIRRMSFAVLVYEGHDILVARTGYTGEDGFELYCSQAFLPSLASSLERLFPENSHAWAGLAARDSLRLEAGFPLYGHELSEQVSPLQAGLAWAVDFEKDDFVGMKALLLEREKGDSRRVRFFKAMDRRIPRSGTGVFQRGKPVGKVASGGYSPSLQVPIGTVLFDPEVSINPDSSELRADVRGRLVPIELGKPVLREIKSKEKA